MNKETEVREKIKALRQFYTNLVIYGAITLFCLCIWITMGGAFWPIWVMLGFIISAVMQGIKLGMFPILEDIFPFLKPDWEEEQVKIILKDEESPVNTSEFTPDCQPSPKQKKKTPPPHV